MESFNNVINNYEEAIQIFKSDPELKIFTNYVKMSEFCHQFTPKLIKELENYTEEEKRIIQQKDEQLRQVAKSYHH